MTLSIDSVLIQLCVPSKAQTHTGYPDTTNTTDNNILRSLNQQAGIRCKYLSGNNLPRIKMIRGKLFPDSYFTPCDYYK